MTTAKEIEFQEFIEKVSAFKGRHTELVSVLIPADYNVNAVVGQLEAERSTANNIKSRTTRNNVIDAIEKVVRELKLGPQKYTNGIAIYCGNTSQDEGVPNIEFFAVEPPQPLKVRTYRCDQTFVVEPLKEMTNVTEVYGLLVIERKEATIGLLEGTQIKVLQKMTSGVPGKIRAGGQCLSSDTLIMKDNGEIIEIKEAHNPLILISENFNIEETEKTPVIAKWENSKKLFKITTCYPKFEIKSSQEHTFFVRTEKGIEEKQLSDIEPGDYLLMPEKINLNLDYQKINFTPKIKQEFNMKKVNIPNKFDENIAKIMGYYLGDGNYEVDRISFSEQRQEIADYYKNLIDNHFKVESVIRFREDKGYYQIRVGSRIISQLFKQIFPEWDKTLKQKIPSIVLMSPDSVLASFISGFFDAEGYVSKGRVAFGINNGKLTRQIQFALLRLGIISSISVYDNKRNPYSNNNRYTLSIDDLESLKKFEKLIGFSSNEKQIKIFDLIKSRSNRNKVRQLAVNGKDVARIIRNSGLNTRQFNCPDFFNNKKQLSKEVFKTNILDKIQDSDLKKRLEMFYLSNLIAVKIHKIEEIEFSQTVDIETKNHNFIANGIIVHNSSQRFHRITEGLAKEFFRRVAESMKELFFDMPKLKGILVGGPIPTKEEFLEEGQLVTALRNKVIAVKDIGYADEHGLQLLVEASRDVLAEQKITKEKIILEKFFNTLGKNPDKAAYGYEPVKKALKLGAVDVLIFSEKTSKEIIKELSQIADQMGTTIEIVSKETGEGEQFFNLSGIGAILRFTV
ncbi:MAG TPA: LAGLIDADG family homing endonuclease [Candidatus Paceibacterota bacterium]|nr:LAGLIDADG family homing endonuclease [Candidatus Paceibacterota bacterium]